MNCASSQLAVLLIAGCAPFVAIQSTSANLLQNGDFDTETLTPWQHDDSIKIGDPDFEGATGTASAVFGYHTPDGYLGQPINTVAGQSYQLTFEFGATGLAGETQELQVTVADQSGDILVASVSSTTPDFSFFDPAVFELYQFNFVAREPTTTIRFDDVSINPLDANGVLDSVSVVAVPEPSSLARLMAAAFLAFCLRRRG